VDHLRAVNDDNLARLYTLTAKLTERLADAQNVRARLTKALAMNAWPDVRASLPQLGDRAKDER
jgi:hypothetical protein